jgi:hypothetical protein
MCFTVNVSGLIVGSLGNNSQCFEQKILMDFPLLLLIVSGMAIVNNITFIILFTISLIKKDNRLFANLGVYGLTLLIAYSSIVILFLGIGEIYYEYGVCFKDVPITCVTVVMVLIFNFITEFFYGWTIIRN